MTVLRAHPRPAARHSPQVNAVLAGLAVALAVGVSIVLTLH